MIVNVEMAVLLGVDSRMPPSNSIEPLQEALRNQPFHVPVTHIELAVFGQVDGTIFCLNFTGVLQHSHVDEKIPRWFKAPSQINIRPLALVTRQEIVVLTEVFLFFWA